MMKQNIYSDKLSASKMPKKILNHLQITSLEAHAIKWGIWALFKNKFWIFLHILEAESLSDYVFMKYFCFCINFFGHCPFQECYIFTFNLSTWFWLSMKFACDNLQHNTSKHPFSYALPLLLTFSAQRNKEEYSRV